MWKQDLREVARRQHGVIGGRDLDHLGMKSGAFGYEMRAGRWESRARHVWSLAGSPDSKEQRLMIGLLSGGPGSAVSHQSAAALWQLPGYELEPIHLTRIRGTNSTTPAGTIVHRARRLKSEHIVSLGPFAVVRPEILLIQMAGVLYEAQTEILLDRLWTNRMITGHSLAGCLEEMSARGRRGMPLLRRLLEERGPGWTPPASGLESRVRSVLEREGIYGFRMQVNIGHEQWIGRVDFAHDQCAVLLEVQSDKFHTALTDRRRDAIRHARLRAAGFRVVEIWESDVWVQPGSLVRCRSIGADPGCCLSLDLAPARYRI